MRGSSPAEDSQWRVLGVVSFYLVAAILMVTVNKWVLISLPIPIFFLFCQLLVAIILLLVSHHLKLLVLPLIRLSIARQLIPLVIVNVLGLTFNTLCLQYVDASFYQIARGLVLPLTVSLAFATNQSPPGPLSLLCCGVVTTGFFVGVANDVAVKSLENLSTIGVTFGVLSSFSTAGHSIIIKSSLATVGNSAVGLAWYTNVLSAIAILPVLGFSGEMHAVARVLTSPEESRSFLIGTALTGVFGFLICVAGFLSIKVTSPVTHIVSSAARGVIQILFGVALFGDKLTFSRGSAILIATAGSCGYLWAKHHENKVPPQLSSLPSAQEHTHTVPPASDGTLGGLIEKDAVREDRFRAKETV